MNRPFCLVSETERKDRESASRTYHLANGCATRHSPGGCYSAWKSGSESFWCGWRSESDYRWAIALKGLSCTRLSRAGTTTEAPPSVASSPAIAASPVRPAKSSSSRVLTLNLRVVRRCAVPLAMLKRGRVSGAPSWVHSGAQQQKVKSSAASDRIPSDAITSIGGSAR